MNTRICFIILLFAGLALQSCGGQDESEMAEQSEPTEAELKEQAEAEAEAIEQAVFTDLEGEEVRVSDFRGKVVLIDLWETWCAPCLATFPTLQKLREEYPDDFAVLAVTPGFTDTAEDARKFREEHQYDFHFLMDSGKLNEKLGVQGIPYKIYVGADGELIEHSMGSYSPAKEYEVVREIIETHRITVYREQVGAQLQLRDGLKTAILQVFNQSPYIPIHVTASKGKGTL